MNSTVLELKHIRKLYPGVVALDGVSMAFKKGEVHAIVGENGAGKSTFIKCITGAIEPTEGEVIYKGEFIAHNNPAKSLEMGICAVYQEFNLIPYLNVTENIFYGRYKTRGMFVDYESMYKETKEILDDLGVDIDPRTLVKDLTVGYQQIIEIAKSISRRVKVIIMDEPSAPLTNNEIVYLFRIVRKLKQRGCAIIYISHRLEEIFEICDKVTVFRDGKYIQTLSVAETNKEQLIKLMVNRDLGEQFPPKQLVKKDKVLEVRGLHTDRLKDIHFEAYEGEILGFAGLVGAGRTEIARAVFGADKIKSGEILLNGTKLNIHSPKDAIASGIGLIPEDRKQHGALLHMSIQENTTYAHLSNFADKFGLIDSKKETKAVQEYKEALKIKTPSLSQKVKNLSGGNQQKVVLAKWLITDCKVLIFDEPTRGIDVGAKQEIYQLMIDLAKQGKVIIMISSEMPELLGMSDRIIVMHEGRITGELYRDDATQEKILSMASGGQEEVR